jgi:hypothetical protein
MVSFNIDKSNLGPMTDNNQTDKNKLNTKGIF